MRAGRRWDGVDDRGLVPMTTLLLDKVMDIENAAYAVPWTRGNFVDSLASGHVARCLFDDRANLVGYFVALHGAGEMHLLNLTVAPAQQRRGHARHMLDALVAACRASGLAELWLEVRVGNDRARTLYRHYGMEEVGLRKAYYPPAPGNPGALGEDAVVMRMSIDGGAR